MDRRIALLKSDLAKGDESVQAVTMRIERDIAAHAKEVMLRLESSRSRPVPAALAKTRHSRLWIAHAYMHCGGLRMERDTLTLHSGPCNGWHTLILTRTLTLIPYPSPSPSPPTPTPTLTLTSTTTSTITSTLTPTPHPWPHFSGCRSARRWHPRLTLTLTQTQTLTQTPNPNP